MRCAKAPSTQAGYQSAGAAFFAWLGASPSVDQLTLAVITDYLVYLFDRRLCYASANKFRCWLAQEEQMLLGSGRLSSDRRFILALQGYENATLDRSSVTAPIRQEVLLNILASERLKETAKHMAALAYVCFLRYAEAVDVFNGISHLSHAFGGFLLHLTHSKCDPHHRGILVRFSLSEVPSCLRPYLDAICGQPATRWDVPSRSFWSRVLSLFVGGGRFHGFRHGRVVDLIYAGMPKEHIMSLGRWASLTGFRHYDAHKL
jgi:hypothetical protein